jgi:hypothetical protein
MGFSGFPDSYKAMLAVAVAALAGFAWAEARMEKVAEASVAPVRAQIVAGDHLALERKTNLEAELRRMNMTLGEIGATVGVLRDDCVQRGGCQKQ